MVSSTNSRVGYVIYLATGMWLTWSLFRDAYAALFVAELQSPSESGSTSRYFTVDSTVDIGGRSSP